MAWMYLVAVFVDVVDKYYLDFDFGERLHALMRFVLQVSAIGCMCV